MIRVAATLALLLSLSTLCHAELPPSAYEAMQKKAPEYLEIKVLQVTVGPSGKEGVTIIEATAQVVDVKRSESGVKSNALIHIVYTIETRPEGFVGPSPIPVLKQGEQTIAFLQKIPDSMDFRPAAGAMSFEKF